MKAHSEKFMDSVPQHDGQSKQQDRERANLDARFPVSPANNTIVTEQIRINPVIRKKATKFAARILQEKSPR